MNEVKVKDFIIDMSNINKIQEKGVVGTKNPPKVKYNIVLENDMDFVVKRTTSKTDKDLVFLVSQDLFYIKDNKKNIVQTLNGTNNHLKNFLKDIGSENFSGFTEVNWIKYLNVEKLEKVLLREDERLLIKNGLNSLSRYCVYDAVHYLKINKKLFKYMYDKIGYSFDNSKEIYTILKEVDYNNAKYFVDCLKDTRMNFNTYRGYNDFGYMMKEYNLDPNTYIEYITYGLYSQGIREIHHSILRLYNDYLNMCNEMYGKIKIKYPKNLKTDHDKISAKYTLWKKYKDDLSIFENSKEWEYLEFNQEKYSIILPKTSSDIIDEGQNQSHCVASYVDKVVNNETTIVFMRLTEDIESSLITIEVKDKEVKQVKGFGNRPANKDEVKFIKAWAKNKKLKILKGVI